MTKGESIPSNEARNELRAFVTSSLERYAEYHNHKEEMAYVGAALYAAAAVTVLVSPWPPAEWHWHPKIVGAVALSALWLSVLIYLRFQLRRRRWAALRIAGCDRLSASWLPGAPMPDDKVQADAKPWNAFYKALDLFWPQPQSKVAVDESIEAYPTEIREAWRKASLRGTEAIHHERLIHVVGWLLYAATIARTALAL